MKRTKKQIQQKKGKGTEQNVKETEYEMKEKKLKIMKEDLLEFFVTLECQYGHDFEFCSVRQAKVPSLDLGLNTSYQDIYYKCLRRLLHGLKKNKK